MHGADHEWKGAAGDRSNLVPLPHHHHPFFDGDARARLKQGDTARFTVDALGGAEFEGTVAEILPVADPESRTLPVRLRVENPQRRLLPGMFARATVAVQDDSWLVVPKDAISLARGQTFVVVADNGVARSVPVRLGAGDETSQAVAGEGLKEGDLVITRGNEGLMNGTPLQVLNPPETEGAGPPGGGPPGGGPPAGQRPAEGAPGRQQGQG